MQEYVCCILTNHVKTNSPFFEAWLRVQKLGKMYKASLCVYFSRNVYLMSVNFNSSFAWCQY